MLLCRQMHSVGFLDRGDLQFQDVGTPTTPSRSQHTRAVLPFRGDRNTERHIGLCHLTLGPQGPERVEMNSWPHSKIKTDPETEAVAPQLGQRILSPSLPSDWGRIPLPMLCFSLHTSRDRQLTTSEAACSIAGWL